METLEAIFTRSSVREYTPHTMPDELVQELLAAAMQAPSAGNQHPWRLIIVTEHQKQDALADALPFGKMLHTAPLGIVVCVNTELEKHHGFWVQDSSNAIMNLLLAAHDQGLGAIWLGVYPVEERVTGLKQILDLPASVISLSVVPLGYPVATPETPIRRYNHTSGTRIAGRNRREDGK